VELTYWTEIVEIVKSRHEKWVGSNLVVNCCIKPILQFVSDTIFYFLKLAILQRFYYRYSIHYEDSIAEWTPDMIILHANLPYELHPIIYSSHQCSLIVLPRSPSSAPQSPTIPRSPPAVPCRPPPLTTIPTTNPQSPCILVSQIAGPVVLPKDGHL